MSLPLFAVSQVDYKLDFARMLDYNTSDDDKIAISNKIAFALVDDMTGDAKFLDSLNVEQISIIKSKDQLLTICTWHYILSDGIFQYGGIINYKGKLQILKYNDKVILDFKKYKADNWCGGIYYDIATHSEKHKKYYTLLAWDGNNGVVSKKIIDVLVFDANDNPIFGLPLFIDGRRTTNRVIIEYSAKASLLLRFNEAKNVIITNSLVADDVLSDIGGLYEIGNEFNEYRFEKSSWVLYRSVDLRMDKAESEELKQRNFVPIKGL